MAEIIGHVDTRNRPLISLSIPGTDDDVLVAVDTGFNGELLIERADVNRFRCVAIDLTEAVELANREIGSVGLGLSDINWLGGTRQVTVYITEADQPRAALPDEPVALLGTALFSPHKLTIDFATRRVVITDIDQAGAS